MNSFGFASRAAGSRGVPRCGSKAALRLLAYTFSFGLAAGLCAQQSALEEGRVRFRAVEIHLDSKGTPLAAYQLEFTVTNSAARIVGIEGGEHPAFQHPPFFDREAMQKERVILATFSTNPPARLPSGKTRVATIHVELRGAAEPSYDLKVEAAADSDGKRIAIQASCEEKAKDEN